MLEDSTIEKRTPRKTIRRISLHVETISVVREMILDGTLPPGGRIAEIALCEDLGISRTPLREAIKVLASEGLIELMPSQGAVVTEVTIDDVEALFEIMEALEDQVGQLVATRATDEQFEELRAMHERMIGFHREGKRSDYFDLNQQIHLRLATCTGNKFLATDYEKYLGKIRRARYLANLSKSRWDESAKEHEEIMAALWTRDGRNLGGILREHLRRTGVFVIEAVKAQHATPTEGGAENRQSIKRAPANSSS